MANPFEEYLSIILYWQHNPPAEGVACHVHHVWPLSCGGPDEDWNKVKLPVKEHYNCHKLLPLIYTGNEQYKMAYAWNRMHLSKDGMEITAEEYERLMTLLHEARKQPKSPEMAQHLSEAIKGHPGYFTGKTHTEETKEKISEKAIARGPCGASVKGRTKGHKGYFEGCHHTEEARQKIKDAIKARGVTGAAAGGIPWTEERRRKVKETWERKRQASA